MVKTLALIIALAFTTVGSKEAVIQKYDVDVMMAEVCHELKTDCANIETPVVVISKIMTVGPLLGYYGLYWNGEPYIFVSPINTAPVVRSTIYHELVHYVAHEIGWKLERCAGEQLARDIEKQFSGIYDPTWRKRYGCEKKDDEPAKLYR